MDGKHNFQLFVDDEKIGALNLYAITHAFTDDSEDVGLVVAAHAAVAFGQSRHKAQLHQAITSRDIIGQAKGVLIERYKITGEQAFLLLAEASSRTNTKLHKVAEHLVLSEELRSEPNGPKQLTDRQSFALDAGAARAPR